MKIVGRIVCYCCLLLLCACNPVSDSMVVIEIDGQSWADHSPFVAGQVYRIHVSAESTSDKIEQLIVESFDKKRGTDLLLDTIFTRATLRKDVYYNWTVPLYDDTTDIVLKAILLVGNKELIYSYPARILPSDRGLRTIDNITLYSAASGKKSGFSMIELRTLYADTLKNDSLCFFDHTPVGKPESDSLHREWISYKGLYFARFESFDFNEAQVNDLQRAYNISHHDDIIGNIRYDDVILIGTSTEVLAAVKVLLVADDPGAHDDRYVFSMKAIKQP